MKDQLISFEIAKLAKEKGFNIPGYLEEVWLGNSYKENKPVSVMGLGSSSKLPTLSLLQKWMRDEHRAVISVDIDDTNRYFITISKHSPYEDGQIYGKYNTYEEALEEGLLTELKKIKKK